RCPRMQRGWRPFSTSMAIAATVGSCSTPATKSCPSPAGWWPRRGGGCCEEEAHRGSLAARGDQQGVGAGEEHPSRPSEHAAPVVGAAAAGGGAGGDLRADGGRSLGEGGSLP